MLAGGLISAGSALAIRPYRPPRLFARLTVTPVAASDNAVRVTIELTNPHPAPVRYSRIPFVSPITCLEVQDGQGNRVPTVPPPVPRPVTPDDTLTLQPRATQSYTFTLGVFSPSLPVGRYTVRVRSALPIDGLPAAFQIGP